MIEWVRKLLILRIKIKKNIWIIFIFEIEENHFAFCIKENGQIIIKGKNITILYMIKNKFIII